MELIIEKYHTHTCCKKVVNKNSDGIGSVEKWTCGKPAVYENTIGKDTYYYCRHHSKMGRYIARVGDKGEIKARFDTESELRANINLFPDCRMQKVGRHCRKDIF
jgi:hypothetical protein